MNQLMYRTQIRTQHPRLQFAVHLVHHTAVLKMLYQIILPLNPCIIDHANLLRIKLLPFCLIELSIKRLNRSCTQKVDKCVPDVALVFEVDWLVKKVVLAFEVAVYTVQHEVLGVLVRNVSNHYCSLVGV